MGGCASKPKDLDTDRAPAPVEAPAPAAEAPAEKSEAETVEHVSEKYLTHFSIKMIAKKYVCFEVLSVISGEERRR